MITGITGLGQAFDNYVMNSQSNIDKVVKEFDKYIRQGIRPEDAERRVWIGTGIDPKTLTDYEKKEILRKVEALYKAHREGV